jgi:anti-sigma factor RsiW
VSRELTCREVVELLNDYLDDALSPEARRLVDEHLSRCEDCSGYLAQLRLTIAATGRLTQEALSPDARERLLHAFRGWKGA